MVSEPGFRLLAGRYRLLRPLGQGGMGTVWYAEHLSLRSSVAVKLLEPHIAEDPQSLQRFMNEARAAAALRSPHVVQILDHGVDEGTPFIVMELLEGECLSDRLARVTTLSLAETARIVTQVARALSRAHEAGIVHRDLKPGNVFLVRNDDEEIAKLFDFGIAKTQHTALGSRADTTTTPGTLVGTPYYMSPEQAQGEATDFRTDLWALGVIAFECLVGRRPFEADSLGSLLVQICRDPLPVPSKLAPVPEAFDVWFARNCSRDIDRRFSSAREAAAELRVACAAEGAAADWPIAAGPPPAKGSPSPWLVGAGAAAIALTGAAVWALASLALRPEPERSTELTSSTAPARASADVLAAPLATSSGSAESAPDTSRRVSGAQSAHDAPSVTPIATADLPGAPTLPPRALQSAAEPAQRPGPVQKQQQRIKPPTPATPPAAPAVDLGI